MQKKSVEFAGKILYVSGDNIYMARGPEVFYSDNGGESWCKWIELPVNRWQKVAMRISLFSRLFRLGVHHLAHMDSASVIVANKESFLVQGGEVTALGPLRGSRPMVLCCAQDEIYYGEYRSNQERSPVSIYKLDSTSCSWRPAWTFEDVRHVHGIFYDPFTSSIWVTTGDSDQEAAIWCTQDRFDSLQRVAGGSQQFRAVQLLFSKEYIYFGSDAPDELNHIYRMDRSGEGLESLTSVGGSIFYGTCVDGAFFFSTAVEPSKINTTRFVELWQSNDGVDWEKIAQFRKDFLPMKYFQYGQMFFPAGEGDSTYLWYSPFATENNGKSFKYPLS